MDKSEQIEPTASKAHKGTHTPECVKKERTVGNIVYDVGVFGSVAFAGVAVLSAMSAHESMHGKNVSFDWLRTLNDKAGVGLFKFFKQLAPHGTPKETIEGYAKGTGMFLTLGMGGNALMAPIKWLEDNRQRNAAYIDNFLGTTPPDPETIKHEPKQTWHSVLSGRLMSWGASWVAFLVMGPKLTSKISNAFGEAATKIWMSRNPKSNPKDVRRWANIAAFDTTFTVITALLTYGLSRYVAGSDEHKQEVKLAAIKEKIREEMGEEITAPPVQPHETHAHVQEPPKPRHASRFTSNRDRDNPEKTRFGQNIATAAERPLQVAL